MAISDVSPRKGLLTEADFAADLAQVLRGDAPEEYLDPVRFFANTHPTRGLQNLLLNVCGRLRGEGGGAASIFRLDTNYGGGKTHALIPLTHTARGMPGVQNVEAFIDPALLPPAGVRIAAFDGENADPANGRSLGNGLRAYTPWGEIAYALAGGEGYARVRKSDEKGVAPGAGHPGTLRRRSGPHSHRRTLRLSPETQGRGPGSGRRPVDRLSDRAVQGGGGHAQKRPLSTPWPSARTSWPRTPIPVPGALDEHVVAHQPA